MFAFIDNDCKRCALCEMNFLLFLFFTGKTNSISRSEHVRSSASDVLSHDSRITVSKQKDNKENKKMKCYISSRNLPTTVESDKYCRLWYFLLFPLNFGWQLSFFFFSVFNVMFLLSASAIHYNYFLKQNIHTHKNLKIREKEKEKKERENDKRADRTRTKMNKLIHCFL